LRPLGSPFGTETTNFGVSYLSVSEQETCAVVRIENIQLSMASVLVADIILLLIML
jgi:hypothetical protein